MSLQPPIRILLLGHDGQIGGQLVSRLRSIGPVTGVSFPQVDFSDANGLRNLVRDLAPELIVNAAAYTAVDQAESDHVTAFTINADGPRLLAEEADRLGAGLVHYSTDFVFDGKKGRPYTEEDVPNPINVYGRSKHQGDEAVMRLAGRHLIFRVGWIYGHRGRNFLKTIQRLACEQDEIRVVEDQIGCPTWCDSVADATVSALHAIFSEADWRAALAERTGTYNMVCSGETSWYGLAREVLPPEVAVVPIATDMYPTPARRPAYSVMDCGKLSRTFGITMPLWREALSECLKNDSVR